MQNTQFDFKQLIPPTIVKLIPLIILLLISSNMLPAKEFDYITQNKGEGYFTLANTVKAAPIYVSSEDHKGVCRVLELFQKDILNVTGEKPQIFQDSIPHYKEIIIVGSLDKSPIIQNLVDNNKLDVSDIKGRWENSLIQTVHKPYPNVEKALVVTGSDKRGTIYSMFDISQEIGVSPWYWWADVPVKEKDKVFVKPGRYNFGEPKVKYRGIFLNDEEPALGGWAREKFGGINHKFYEHVFQLILRNKGNFLWPAMWGKAFYDDDPLNPKLADEYGIVINFSHHEPMMRSHVEWDRYGEGPWNYRKNEERLQEFWRKGIQRMDDNESIVTIGMRGDGDKPMSEEANIDLLERIVKDQRQIIEDVTGKEAEEVPQVWALYKEVQEYYEKGMRVPDDVTLLLCDDNWGNLRMLPDKDAPKREGGFGIYYHFDYVGGPRNYKWLNTNQISRVWEQMHLAYEYNAREIWVVNVGDLKPMEFPIDFFLDYAWNPEAISAEEIPQFTRKWAEEQFGSEYASEVAYLIREYTRYNSRRTPELLSPETYSLTNYREAERIVKDYNQLETRARAIYNEIDTKYQAAFYQLVLHPIEACANLNELYVSAAKNHMYAEQGRVLTNKMADKVKELFDKDAEITNYYNNIMAGGKWSHMMDQTHIGYTYWQQPEQNNMPEVKTIKAKKSADIGVAIQGSAEWWPKSNSKASLSEFDSYNKQSYFIEIFNRGKEEFDYQIEPSEPWIKISSTAGIIKVQKRFNTWIDWENAPQGKNQGVLNIKGNKEDVKVHVTIHKKSTDLDKVSGFVESNGYISIEAPHYTNAIGNSNIHWQLIPGLGKTLAGITPMPVTASAQEPGDNAPHLEYRVHINNPGKIKVKTFLSPTLNFQHDQGLRYGISFNDQEPQIVNMHESNTHEDWQSWVANSINNKVSTHEINKPGEHVLKFWMVDPAVVLQKIVIETTGTKPSYLGPPESFKAGVKNDMEE